MDYAVDALLLHQGQHSLEIADIHPDEPVVRPVLDIPEVGQVAGIGQLVQIDDPVIRIFVHEKTDHVGADETGASRNHYPSSVFHLDQTDLVPSAVSQTNTPYLPSISGKDFRYSSVTFLRTGSSKAGSIRAMQQPLKPAPQNLPP